MASKGGRQGSAEKVTSIPHTRVNDEKQMEEIYEIKGLLGEGNFGVVREVVHRDTNERWACKAINKEKAGSSRLKLLEREVDILKRVQHEHIIRLKEVFETSQKVYLVMELCMGGELSKYLHKHGPMDESSVKQIMSRLASAISYLHKYDMVHRDLKLENILLKPNPHNSADKFYIKVTDFGLSVVKGGVGHENMMMDFCGTPLYMAPEILDNKAYGQLCDVWAMGIIMYSLITGAPPFQSSVDEELYNMIRTADVGKAIETNEHWKKFSKEAKDLIIRMLDKDPAHRLQASEVRDDTWITGQVKAKNVLELMKEFHSSNMNGEQDGVSKSTEDEEHPACESQNSSLNNNISTSKKSVSAKEAQKVGSKSLTPNRSTLSKSRSPPATAANPGSRSKGQGQQYHGTKPSATHTYVSTSSSVSHSSSNRTNPSQSADHNHKPKKKKVPTATLS